MQAAEGRPWWIANFGSSEIQTKSKIGAISGRQLGQESVESTRFLFKGTNAVFNKAFKWLIVFGPTHKQQAYCQD